MVLLNIELVVFLAFIHNVRRLDTLQAVSPTLGLLLFLAAQAYLLARQPTTGDPVGAGKTPTAERAVSPALPS
jgi:hypothetical protein